MSQIGMFFHVTFNKDLLEKKVPSSFRVIWDIYTKRHSSKKLGFDTFLVHFWTKNCKKTADFQVAKNFSHSDFFYFIAKINYFRHFL